MLKRKPPLASSEKDVHAGDHPAISREFLKQMETPEEKTEWTQVLAKSTYFRNILEKVLTNKLERAILELRSEGLTKNPDYAISVADNLGYQRALAEIVKLLQDKTNA